MVMRILNLIALIILLAHWNGCLQFMIPIFQNFPSDCWVPLNGLQNALWTVLTSKAFLSITLSLEICLLTRAKRVANVRCVTYSLDSGQFELVLESYPLMRRTMESVAAERLIKLGKNPSIISTRHDLKRDTAALKDMIDRVTLQPSSDEEEDNEDFGEEKQRRSSFSLTSSSSIRSKKSNHFKSCLMYLHKQFSESNNQLENGNEKRRKRIRKVSSGEKKFQKLTRLFLAAPQANLLQSKSSESGNQLRKSPSTPWSLFRKTTSPAPSPPLHQPS